MEAEESSLGERLGAENLARRREFEKPIENKSPKRFSAGHFQILWYLCICLGVRRRGLQNFLHPVLERVDHLFPDLPPAFDGFRILHLSDLHLQAHDRLPEAVASGFPDTGYDICVFTGDLRYLHYTTATDDLPLLDPILEKIKAPLYWILGNHDTIDVVAHLEKRGIRVLLNEGLPIERRGEIIWLAGVDDNTVAKTADYSRAVADRPASSFTIFLVHGPQGFRDAEAAGARLMLSGHTHGGQICLPNGKPIIHHAGKARVFARGKWQWRGMTGYTSRGTGGSGAPLRFFCPPEFTLHTLRRFEVGGKPSV